MGAAPLGTPPSPLDDLRRSVPRRWGAAGRISFKPFSRFLRNDGASLFTHLRVIMSRVCKCVSPPYFCRRNKCENEEKGKKKMVARSSLSLSLALPVCAE